MATLITDISSFHTQGGSDAAAAASLTPELPTEIPGVGNLTFFKPKDTQYFAFVAQDQEWHSICAQDGLTSNHGQMSRYNGLWLDLT